MTPTGRTAVLLRSQGYHVGFVERWIPYTQIRQDLFGFADIVAFHPNGHTRFIQVTSAANHAARRTKVNGLPVAHQLSNIHAVEVWSWGKRKAGWTVRVERLRGEAWGPEYPDGQLAS